MSALDGMADWPVKSAAAAVCRPVGVVAEYGDTTAALRAGFGDQNRS